jgi:hypothetical protein
VDIQLVTAPRTGAGVVDAVLGTAEPQIEGSSCFVSANPGGILSPSSDSLVAHRPLAERAHSGSPPASDGGEVTESAAYRETVALLNQINPEAPDTGIMWQSINLLRSLNSEEQVKVCTIGYKKCWTLPMIAVECDDWDVFETVLGMVGGFDVEAQKNIFAAKTSNETTFLKVVTGNTTDKMEKALLTFSKFGSDIQREMFLAETSGGLTLLMDVAVHIPGMLGLAFGMISGFDEITQREILMAKRDYRDYESHTYFSYTASMIVAMHAPDGIALVLDTVGKLGRDAQMALLMTATPSGQAFAGEIVVERPLWKIVAEHAPDRLALVLDTIGKLDREAQTVLLTAAISGGATFLESVEACLKHARKVF